MKKLVVLGAVAAGVAALVRKRKAAAADAALWHEAVTTGQPAAGRTAGT